MSKWPLVPLGQVVSQRKEFIQIDDAAVYKRCRVQLHAQGIVLRDEVPGIEIKTKAQQVCRAGDFLVAEIDAKVGGFGIVPPHLDGAIVSSHYFLFSVNESRMDTRFLDYYARTATFREQVTAQGSTNYAAIRPSHVLAYTAPLPPLGEQRRVVGRIEELAAQIQKVNRLQAEVGSEADTLLMSVYKRITDGAPRKLLSEVAPLNRRPVVVESDQIYPQVAVRSFGRGSFHREPLVGLNVTWEKPFRVKSGDILISNIKAWEGAIAVATEADHRLVASHRYLTCVPIPEVATARFVCFHLLTQEGLRAVGEASPGSADRNRTLGAKALLRIPVPLPPYDQQLEFDEYSKRIDELRKTRKEARMELASVIPALTARIFDFA